MGHITAGVKILSQMKLDEAGRQSHDSLEVSPHPFLDLGHLEVLFNRLDNQIAQVRLASISRQAIVVQNSLLSVRNR